MERILEILGEEKPVGGSYHADLVRRVSRAVPASRPAILDVELAKAVDETRRLRHVARKNYNMFRIEEAAKALAAAEYIAAHLMAGFQRFRAMLEGASGS
ncbi:hypothetical protein [Jiella sp. M17.18]|uniref:ribonuclease toxin HepT-like protein n=1 Tax=Jiella sp. M17.18 TaxID=3234247 RepID=UPI0034DE9E03